MALGLVDRLGLGLLLELRQLFGEGLHGLLDALTDGGLGVALAWPWSDARIFAPWRPLPVAPIGGGLLSLRGARVMALETLVFAPLLLYGLWPRRASDG